MLKEHNANTEHGIHSACNICTTHTYTNTQSPNMRAAFTPAAETEVVSLAGISQLYKSL